MRFKCFSWFVSGFDDQLTTAHKNRDRFKVIEFHCMIHFNCFFVVEMTTGFLVSNHESFFLWTWAVWEEKKEHISIQLWWNVRSALEILNNSF